MISHDFDLNAISVRKPCHEDWDAMTGDDRARFCGKCEKKVYNLSEMTEHEAKALILEKRGDLCVQFYRRADGTLATASCPTGFLGVPRRKLARAAAAAVAAGTMIAGSAFAGGNDRTTVANDSAAQAAAALRAQHTQTEMCQVAPAAPATTVTYTVREGDTLADILAQWNSQRQWVREANPDVDLTTLKAGQKLRVPFTQVTLKGKVAVSTPATAPVVKGEMVAPTPAPTTPAPAAPMMRGEMVPPTPAPAARLKKVMGKVIAPGGPVTPAPAPTTAAPADNCEASE